jgi:hypothetical protein
MKMAPKKMERKSKKIQKRKKKMPMMTMIMGKIILVGNLTKR